MTVGTSIALKPAFFSTVSNCIGSAKECSPLLILEASAPRTSSVIGQGLKIISQGTLQVDCWSGWKLETGNECQQRSCFDEGTSIAERALVGMTGALKEFVTAIRESRGPDPLPEESLVSQRLIEQAYLWAKRH